MKDKTPISIFIILVILAGLAFSPGKKLIEAGKSNNQRKISSSERVEGESPVLGYTQNKEVAEDIKKIEEEVENLENSITKLKNNEKTRSPYYNKIRMSGLSGKTSNDPSRQYITLSTNLKKTESANITGWFLKSEVTGYQVVIGKASLLPFPFKKIESDVVLQHGDKVILTKGFSPIGISFRTNICTGYFEENRTFIPSLAKRCPLPKNEKLPTFSSIIDRNDECVKLIERIGRCTTRGGEFIRDLPDTVTDSCKNYIRTQINYESCIAKHFSDTNFPGNEYRIYLNKFGPLWRIKNEIISLYDSNGLLVDSIRY